jgi:hypothetical protein
MNPLNLHQRLQPVLKALEHFADLSLPEREDLRAQYHQALLVHDPSGFDAYGDSITVLDHAMDVLSQPGINSTIEERLLPRIALVHKRLQELFIGLELPEGSENIDMHIREANEEDQRAILSMSEYSSWCPVDGDDFSSQPIEGKWGDFFAAIRTADDSLRGYVQMGDAFRLRPGQKLTVGFDAMQPGTHLINIATQDDEDADTVRHTLLQAALTRLQPIGRSELIEFSPPVTDEVQYEREILEEFLVQYRFRMRQVYCPAMYAGPWEWLSLPAPRLIS